MIIINDIFNLMLKLKLETTERKLQMESSVGPLNPSIPVFFKTVNFVRQIVNFIFIKIMGFATNRTETSRK